MLEDEEIRSGIKAYTYLINNVFLDFCRSWPTIPQVFVKGNFLGGCDLLMEMHSSGDLKALLSKEQILPKEEAAETK